MTDARKHMHDKIEDVEQFVRLNEMKINESKKKSSFLIIRKQMES